MEFHNTTNSTCRFTFILSKILDTSLYHFAKVFVDILHSFKWWAIECIGCSPVSQPVFTHCKFSNADHLKTARYHQILWKNDRVICLVFLRFFLHFLSTIRAFSKVVSLVSLTTFIHPFFSVHHIYTPLQVFN